MVDGGRQAKVEILRFAQNDKGGGWVVEEKEHEQEEE